MNASLTREEWKTVYRALDNAQSPSPLKGAIVTAGQSTTDDEFNVEGSYYDFAEACYVIDEHELSREIAIQLATELWREVQSLNPKDQDAIRQQEHGRNLQERPEGKGNAS